MTKMFSTPRITRRAAFLCAVFIAPLIASAPAYSYALSVFGNADGKACYQAAKIEKASKRNFERCAKALDDGRLSQKDRAAVLTNRGILHRIDGDYLAAWTDYKAALSLAPDLPEAFANRGNLYYLSEKYDRAILDYNKALELGISDERGSRLNIAMSLGNLKRDQEAAAQYLDVIARYPDWELARVKYDYYLEKRAKRMTEPAPQPTGS